MRNLALISLILLLSLSYAALAGLQLGGDNGRSILASLTENTSIENVTAENMTTENMTNSSPANSSTAEPEDLWSWGKIPIGHTLNGSGLLVETQKPDPFVEIPPRGGI